MDMPILTMDSIILRELPSKPSPFIASQHGSARGRPPPQLRSVFPNARAGADQEGSRLGCMRFSRGETAYHVAIKWLPDSKKVVVVRWSGREAALEQGEDKLLISNEFVDV